MYKLISVFLLGVLILSACIGESGKATPVTNIDQAIFFHDDAVSHDGFQKVTDPIPLVFPQDMGSHPEIASEWWYYTGNLKTIEGRHFGYQLTFFRRSILPLARVVERQSDWATNDIYMAHFTLTDSANEEHYSSEAFSRGAVGLAGASVEDGFSVWLNHWRIEQIGHNSYSLFASTEDISIKLTLEDVKGIVLHGENGLSQKGPEKGNASMYFSQTRLKSNGSIEIGGETFLVDGYSWMDHEFGTSALGENQIGWDWFSMQLDTETEIMLFQIREIDGSVSSFSSGSIIYPDGQIEGITLSDFRIAVKDEWQSADGVVYPSQWEIQVGENIFLALEPVMADQENKLAFRYWEGAVRISGQVNGKDVSGYGYVEMTGYAESMQGVF